MSWRAVWINRRYALRWKRRQAPHPESHHSTTSFARSKAKLDDSHWRRTSIHLRLSDSTMATILNCITELDADSLVTAEYIKSFRQKELSEGQITAAVGREPWV